MYYPDRYDRPITVPQSGAYVTAEELKEMIELMSELRRTTQSRSTFRATAAFLARFAGEDPQPSLVPADGLEG